MLSEATSIYLTLRTHLVILQGNFFELTINHGLSLESRSRLLDLSSQEGGGGREVARLHEGKLLARGVTI